jgi:nascent polypeptide-associated complex subunit alpha
VYVCVYHSTLASFTNLSFFPFEKFISGVVNGASLSFQSPFFQTLFVVSDPDVFKSPSGEIYVIFGEPKVDQGSSALAQAAAGGLGQNSALGEDAPALVEESAPAASGASSEESGEFAAKDIDLVMAQGNCTREKAVEALRKTKGDIVTAIMDLTVSS